MKLFAIPVVYQVTGDVVVEAESLEALLQQIRSGNFDTSTLPLPKVTSYLEDSFEIDTNGGTIVDILTGESTQI